MEINGSSSSGGKKTMISADEVVEKLKDEGDFDRLRLKIIRKLKENEELRNNIISAVKQSAAINRAGAENLKPRQLSDAIHEEIGSKVMGQMSDALWEVIRSGEGIQSEIRETVESVYNRLLNPEAKEVDESHSHNEPTPSEKEASNNCSATAACERNESPLRSEPKEPPGFSTCNSQQANNYQVEEHRQESDSVMRNDHESNEKQLNQGLYAQQDVSSPSNPSVPPGFGGFVNGVQSCNGIDYDDDPDVPPGFG